VGREVARQLINAGEVFVVLDVNPGPVQAARALGYLFLEEDASQDEVLRKVHIERARALIACADSDVNNVYVTLTARAANPNLFIVARAAQADAEPKLYKAGANRVVSPYVMAGRHMAELAARPLVADYLNLLFDGQEIDVQIQEVVVDGRSALSNRTIRDVHEAVLDGAFVLAMDRDGTRTLHVGPDEVLREGDRLLVVGSGAQLRKLTTIK
jgi:voltage-gated potassium channel